MYTRCGSLAEASATLCKLPSLSVVSWNIMIGGYASCGVHVAALNLFEKMQQEGTSPTRATFLGMLEACKSKEAVREGRYIHCHVMESTLRFDQAVGNAITVMYIMCGSFKEGFGQFWALLDRDVVSWSTIIAGCVQHDEGLLALEYFQDMQQQGIVSNNIIFSSILKACASIRATGQGRLIHSQIIQCGTRLDDIVGNVLVDMYAKCESLMEACRAFDNLSVRDVISWGSIIGGYVEQGECRIALKYFSDMLRGGIKPNNAAFSCALRACANIGAIYEGRFIHEKVMITGLQMDDILQNSFVIMYAKCGYLEEAQKFFNRIPNPDVSLWGAMIAEYAHYGEGFAALKCFDGMIQRCIKPDEILFSSILVACSRAGLLDEGWWYYKSMVGHYGIPSTTFHSSCMIDLLCRAGHINEVKMLLQNTVHLNILGWTSLLGVCRMHSNVKIGKHCFDKVISFDPQSAACYVLMSNIYAEAHMHQNACRI